MISQTFLDRSNKTEDYFILKLLSFNILAQNLLEDHSYLYVDHNKKALNWKTRKPLIIQEIFETEANVHIYSLAFNNAVKPDVSLKREDKKILCTIILFDIPGNLSSGNAGRTSA